MDRLRGSADIGRSAPDRPLVSVGLVTWNSAPVLRGCLSGLRDQDVGPLEFLVVDNGSADDSAEIVEAEWPTARLIRNSTNTGFCHAHNQAIRASKGEYYLALNPDVRLARGYVAELLEALTTRPSCGSVAGKLLQSDGAEGAILDSTGLFIDRRRRQFLRGAGEVDQGRYEVAEEVFGVDGAAPLYRRAMLEDTAFAGECFDEQFFAHKEDVDLAWRSRLLGWRCWFVPEARAVHPRTFKSGKRQGIPASIRRLAVRNRYLLLIKNEDPVTWRRDFGPMFAYDIQILAYVLLREQSSLPALVDVGNCWSRAWRWRRFIRSRMNVSSKEIASWFH